MLHANMVMARFACLAVAPTLALRGCAFITQPPAYSCRASAGARFRQGMARPRSQRPLSEPRAIIAAAAAAAGVGGTGAAAADTGTRVQPSKSNNKPRVKIRQAREADYEAVAKLRTVVVPLGMDGAVGFMGSKVVIDDPVEAKRRRLMAKVADLISGETIALIALEVGNSDDVVGAVDCSIQPVGLREALPIGRGQGGRRREAAEQEEHAEPRRRGQGKVGEPNRARGGNSPRSGSKTVAPPRPRLFLENLYVLPEHRRRGIARKLVEGAEAFARSRGAGTICMEVARSNDPALDLYRTCGYEAMGAVGGEETLGETLMKILGMGNIYMSKNI